MSTDSTRIEAAIAEPLTRQGLILEDVKVVAAGAHRTVTVMVDLAGETTDPVSLEHIAAATHTISSSLDELTLFNDHPYNLEVTSPGATRPLVTPRHFRRNLGRTLSVRTAADTLQGELAGVGDDEITLRTTKKVGKSTVPTGQEVQIPFADIEKASVVLKFS